MPCKSKYVIRDKYTKQYYTRNGGRGGINNAYDFVSRTMKPLGTDELIQIKPDGKLVRIR